jgi:DNA repair protein RadC
MNVKLTEAQKIHILNSTDVAAVMQQVLLRENKIRRNQEHFWIVGLDNKSKILFIELISLGASNRVNVAAPEVFRMAIYKLASRVIFVHNHPSGEPDPSDADKDFTGKMIIAGSFIDITVIDHLVISDRVYASFVDLGIMEKLQKRNKKLLAAEEEALEQVQQEMVREKIVAETQRNIATKALKEGFTVSQIVKISGLTKAQVEALKKK